MNWEFSKEDKFHAYVEGGFTLLKKIIFFLMVFFLGHLPAYAAPSLKIETLAKQYKEGSMVTLRVTVENTSLRPFYGLVVVKSQVPYVFLPSYEIAVKGLTGSKTWYLKIPEQGFQGKVIARLEEEGKIITKSMANYFVLREYPVISMLYLVPKDNDVPPFLTGKVSKELRQVCELIRADKVRKYDFSAYDMVILEKPQELVLDENAWQELARFVEEGGVLVISGGTSAVLPEKLKIAEQMGVKELSSLPQLESLAGVNLPRASKIAVNILAPIKGAKSKFTVDGINWLIVKTYGAGRVIAVPAYFSDTTFASWQGSAYVWNKLVNEVQTELPALYTPAPYNYGEFGWLLGALLPLDMPAAWALAVIFIIYVLLAGFGSYMLLARMDKRGYMWFAIPVLAVLFFFTTYLYGASKRTNHNVVAETGRINLLSESAVVNAGIALFVPKAGDYTLSYMNNTTLPMITNESDKQTTVIIEDKGIKTVFKDMRVWSMRTIQANFTYPYQGRIAAENITKKGSEVTFTIANNSAYDLSDCFIGGYGSVFAYVPKLLKGEKKQVTVELDKPHNVYEYISPSPRRGARMSLFNLKENLVMTTLNNFKGLPPTGWRITGFTEGLNIDVSVNGKVPEYRKLFIVVQNIEQIGIPYTTEKEVKYQ